MAHNRQGYCVGKLIGKVACPMYNCVFYVKVKSLPLPDNDIFSSHEAIVQEAVSALKVSCSICGIILLIQ